MEVRRSGGADIEWRYRGEKGERRLCLLSSYFSSMAQLGSTCVFSAGENSFNWLGWAHAEARQQGTLSLLVACVAESNSMQPGDTFPSLSAVLLPRLREQVCCHGTDNAPGRDGEGGVRGLQLLQTERCALAAAYASLSRQTGNVQVRAGEGRGAAKIEILHFPTISSAISYFIPPPQHQLAIQP